MPSIIFKPLIIFSLLLSVSIGNLKAETDKFQKWQGPKTLELDLIDLDRNQYFLSDFQGKVLLINFWASWCAPCISEIPSLIRLKKILSEKEFEIFLINFGESKEIVENFVNKNEYKYPKIFLDIKKKTDDVWVTTGLPTTFLLSKKGDIRSLVLGSVEWDDPKVVERILELINEK